LNPASEVSPRLRLMRELTRTFPSWAVWKNLKRTIEGKGDIDAVAPASSWNDVGQAFQAWAFSERFRGVIECRHVPGVLLLMALSPEGPAISELDLCDSFYWRAGRLTTAARVVPLFARDASEIRRFRHGAEGLFLLLFNGVKRGGRQDVRAIRRNHVIELIRSDPEGAHEAASTLSGGVGRPAMKLALAAQDEDWSRVSAFAAEARAVLNGVREPRDLVGRFSFRAGANRTCPVIAATRGGRRDEEDVERWLNTPTEFHSLVRASV
jgi:hypothetical protein